VDSRGGDPVGTDVEARRGAGEGAGAVEARGEGGQGGSRGDEGVYESG